MPGTMQVELVSPERVLFSGDATMVILRTLEGGDIAFQPGHAPFLGALVERQARIVRPDGSVQHVAIHGGFVHVNANTVSILSDGAELAEEIDVARAREAVEKATVEMEKAMLTAEARDDAEAEAALRRAHARLAAAQGMHGGFDGQH